MMRTDIAVPAYKQKCGLYKKTKTNFFLHMHFKWDYYILFIEKIGRKTSLWLACINKGLLLYLNTNSEKIPQLGK